MSTPEIVGFIISIVSLLYLYFKNLNPKQKKEPLDLDDEFLDIIRNKPIKQEKKEWRGRESISQKDQLKPLKKNIPLSSEHYKVNQKPLRAKIENISIPEQKAELPHHSNIRNIMARLSSLPDMVIYHEILSKPKGLREDE